MAGLEDACGSFPEAIAICEKLLDARGHVYPSTLSSVHLEALTCDGRFIQGQAVSSHSHTALNKVRLVSDSGPIQAYEPALEAIEDADLVVLGPGSLFTSIIPNLLVPGIIDAIRRSQATVVFVCSIADVQGETWGLTAKEHLQALYDHGMRGLIDYGLFHSKIPLRQPSPNDETFNKALGPIDEGDAPSSRDAEDGGLGVRPVVINYRDVQSIKFDGVVAMVRDFGDENYPTWHSPAALRQAFVDVINNRRPRVASSGY